MGADNWANEWVPTKLKISKDSNMRVVVELFMMGMVKENEEWGKKEMYRLTKREGELIDTFIYQGFIWKKGAEGQQPNFEELGDRERERKLAPEHAFTKDVPLGSNDVGEKGFSSGARNSRRFKFIAASAYTYHNITVFAVSIILGSL